MDASIRHDAMVIGAGHNGLTAACYLAKAGLRVDVYARKEFQWERSLARARIVPRPFFDPPRRRAVPAGTR